MLKLMQKDQNPLVDHAITTETKFKDMKLAKVRVINEYMQ